MLLLLAACRPHPPATATAETGLGGSDTDTSDPVVTGPTVTLQIVGFNVESGGSDPQIVADETVAPVKGEAVWGFAEVQDDFAAKTLVKAAKDDGEAQDWQYVLGTTGRSDRLVLAWDDKVLKLESSEELYDMELDGGRAPLVGHFRVRENGAELQIVVNHLWRSEAGSRHQQAQLLNQWGKQQDGPVLMVGDYNFDWDVDTGEHDQGYDLLVAKDVFTWVQPKTLLKTECSSFYNSILDFSFVHGPAQDWSSKAEILDPAPEYCQSQHEATWSDHRPVELTIHVPPS